MHKLKLYIITLAVAAFCCGAMPLISIPLFAQDAQDNAPPSPPPADQDAPPQDQQPPQDAAPPQDQQPPQDSAPPQDQPAPDQAQPPQQQNDPSAAARQPESITLPVGTVINVRIADEVSSSHNHPGDLFTGTCGSLRSYKR